MADVRKDLFEVADAHFNNPNLLPETMLLAATTCLAAGMTPEKASEVFNQMLAEVVRCVAHKDLPPLAQVVREEA